MLSSSFEHYAIMDKYSSDKRGAKKLSMVWVVYALIFLSSMDVYYIILPGEVKLNPYFFLSIIVLPFFLFRSRWQKSNDIGTLIGTLLILYLAAGLVGLAVAETPLPLIRGWGAQVLFVECFFLAKYYLKTQRQIELAISCFIFAGLISAVMGIIQFLGWMIFGKTILPPFSDVVTNFEGGSYGMFGYSNGLMRMQGFFTSANRLGAFLIIPFGLALYRLLFSTNHKKSYLAIFAVLAFCIVFSLARNAYIGCLIFILVLASVQIRSVSKKFFVYLVTFMIIISIAIYLKEEKSTQGYLEFLEIGRVDDLGFKETSHWPQHFMAAIEANIETYGLGKGIENFDDWSYNYGYVHIWSSHSNFIAFLGETGIIGASAQILIVFAILQFFMKVKKSFHREQKFDLLSSCLISIYLALVSTGIVRTYYFHGYTMLLMGLMIRVFQLKRNERVDEQGI